MCECMTELNAKLKDHNCRIAVGFMLSNTQTPEESMRVLPLIATEKLAPRGKRPILVVASYCPFCGEKYPDPKRIDQAEEVAA